MRLHLARILGGAVAPDRKVGQGNKPTLQAATREQEATIQASRSPNTEAAARSLRKALMDEGPTSSLAIVLTSYSNKQRQAIKRHYRLLHGKDLEADVEDRLAGHFKTTVLALLQEPMDYLVTTLHATIMKIGPDPQSFVELLYGHDNTEIHNIKELYYKKYGRELMQAIKRELNGDFQCLLRILLSEQREDSGEMINEEQAKKEAQMLSRAGVGIRYGTDEAVIVSLLCTRSYDHLRLMFSLYHHLSGRSIQDAVAADFRGIMRSGLQALVRTIDDHVAFFSSLVHECLVRNIVRDDRLIHILVSHSEVDLARIKTCYLTLYGTKLSSAIMDVTAGDYQQLMYRILHPN